MIHAVLGTLPFPQFRENLVAAGLFLLLGALLIRSIRKASTVPGKRSWIPVAAFVCSLMMAIVILLTGLIGLEFGNPVLVQDWIALWVPVMSIGLFVGVVSAVTFWLVERLSTGNAKQDRSSR